MLEEGLCGRTTGFPDLVCQGMMGPRERLIESLDRIFAESIDPQYNKDSIEGKVFGLGVESYTTGPMSSMQTMRSQAARPKKCLMTALLEPTEHMMKAEAEEGLTRRLALQEKLKMLPAGIVFDEYCARHGVKASNWMDDLK